MTIQPSCLWTPAHISDSLGVLLLRNSSKCGIFSGLVLICSCCPNLCRGCCPRAHDCERARPSPDAGPQRRQRRGRGTGLNRNEMCAALELMTVNEHDAAQMLVRSVVNDVAAGQV